MTNAYVAEHLRSAAETLTKAESWLAADPVRHNLLLALLNEESTKGRDVAAWVLTRDASVAGVALQTSAKNMVNLSNLSPDAATYLAEAVYHQAPDAPGVSGEASAAAHFAGRFSELTDRGARPLRGLRVFDCPPPVRPSPAVGTLRHAEPSDRDRLIEMVAGFYRDISASGDPAATVDARLHRGLYHVLTDEERTVCGIGTTEALHSVARIQFVWTEPSARGAGYASFAITSLVQAFHSAGVRPVLFTDLAVANTNRLYRRLGFRAVSENLQYDFGPTGD